MDENDLQGVALLFAPAFLITIVM